jgi:hypothetical protein
VEHHSGGLQGLPPLVVDAERCEETGARAGSALHLETAGRRPRKAPRSGASAEAFHRPVGDRQDRFLLGLEQRGLARGS